MRRWFQFRLSTLLFAIIVCGVVFAWWRDRRDLQNQLQRQFEESARLQEVIARSRDPEHQRRRSTAVMNLRTLRAQIQLYQAQHKGNPPDAALTGLLIKTDEDGNPGTDFNPFTNSKRVTATDDDPPRAASSYPNRGWLYNRATGNVWLDDDDYLNE